MSPIRALGLALAAAALLPAGPATAADSDQPIVIGRIPNPATTASEEKVPKYWVFGTELPAPPTTPPKLAAPNAELNRGRPPMVTMTWGASLPVFRKPATTPAGIKSLKSK